MRQVIELRGQAGFQAMTPEAGNKTELVVPDEGQFHFRLETCDIGAVAASRIHLSPCLAAPGRVVDSDVVNLSLILRGTQSVRSTKRRRVFRPGQIVSQVGWNRHEGLNETVSESMMLRIDDAVLVERGVHISADSLHFGPDGATTTTHALSALVKATLYGQSLTDEPTPSAVENAVLELIVGLHHESLNYRGSSTELGAGLLARARTSIAASYRDPMLTPSVLAGRLDVTVRRLQRVFEKAGSTAATEIRSLRTTYAVGMLRDRSTTMALPEVAAAAGFTSTGELRRAIRAHYDLTPTQLRE
ncbi:MULTISPECIES: AraC family transcriptional regulator [Rhodococcus]|uniref:AraC family transcriptional regulator n=1 Tax=Rhodococcus erythropolis TaxID=1833 RepID=A0A8I1D9P8_RHOER|nr:MULTISPECIES: helix-turn-helix domain-containing protein [Rhodococcus]MBH5146371.1 AraC family transcriptional regulator [Rhodococcus erythropolis]QXC46856.1 helix-turn-helix domain-containing protein [Rhodococcus qingshengii]